MTPKKIQGILPALITPFDNEGEVHIACLKRYVRHLITKKVHGLFICGSYGSGPLMPPNQRMQVAETVAEEAKGQISILFHVGYADLKTTLQLAREAESLAIDGLASVTPFYYRHNRQAIIDYYRRLIDATPMPIFLYNNPKYAHFTATSDVLAELADYGLAGVKDSSGDIALFYNFLGEVKKEGFTFLIGSQTHLVPAMIGGHMVVSPGFPMPSQNLFCRFTNSANGIDIRKQQPCKKRPMRCEKLRAKESRSPFIMPS